ncbi:MAG: molybdenum ABC transporter ATP-binding protein, partial [Ketobacter sp.]
MSVEARFQIQRSGFQLDVDVSFPSSGVTGLVGPSGCGKTTLLRAIAGLEQEPDGYCRVGNMIWQDGGQFVPVHKRQLGYVFQEASLFSHLSVRGNLNYGLRRTPAKDRRLGMDEVVDLLGLRDLIDRHPEGLSGGERQRVALARALLASPKLLLMDEPLAALDQASKKDILPYLERLHDELNMPVLYVSHAADEVARLADHLIMMEVGRVKASGPITELLTQLDLAVEQGADAEAVIETTVTDYDDEYHLSHLQFAGGIFHVASARPMAQGQAVRLRILARDVSLTLAPQTGTSILNIFPATVEALSEDGPAQCLVRLRIGDTPILARITQKSADVLNLKPGLSVYA